MMVIKMSVMVVMTALMPIAMVNITAIMVIVTALIM